MAFTSISNLLPALKERLAALQWRRDGQPDQNLFETVEFCSHTDLVRALEQLHLNKNRVALIVPQDDDYLPANVEEVQGRALELRVERQVFILMSDRDMGRRQDASTGDESKPGVLLMNELVVNDLMGSTLGIRGVRAKPRHGGPFTLQDKARKEQPGREAWNLELLIESGEAVTVVR